MRSGRLKEMVEGIARRVVLELLRDAGIGGLLSSTRSTKTRTARASSAGRRGRKAAKRKPRAKSRRNAEAAVSNG